MAPIQLTKVLTAVWTWEDKHKLLETNPDLPPQMSNLTQPGQIIPPRAKSWTICGGNDMKLGILLQE